MRPVEARPASYHLQILARMLGQVEADESLPAGSRDAMRRLIAALMAEFQKQVA